MESTKIEELLTLEFNKNHPLQIYTPNFPLAQQLRRLRLMASGQQAMTASNIDVLLSGLNDQVNTCRHEYTKGTTQSESNNNQLWPIASDAQLSYLWETLIEKQSSNNELQLNSTHLASSALSAWKNLKRYKVDHDELQQMELGQLVKFSQWCEEFERLLKERKLTTLEQQIEFLVKNTAPQNGGTLYLYGFIDTPPKLWLEWLEHLYSEIEYVQYSAIKNEGTKNQSFLHGCQSPELELHAALNWAKDLCTKLPECRIAVIDPALKDRVKATTRQVEAFFQAEYQQTESTKPAQINTQFAQELPLSETGLFQTALSLLTQNQKKLSLAQARQIIQSRHWGNFEQEYDLRALWDRLVCGKKSSSISSADFRALLEDAQTSLFENTQTPEEAVPFSENLTTNTENLAATSGNQKISLEKEEYPNKTIAQKLSQAFVKETGLTASKKMPLEWANLFQKQLSILELGTQGNINQPKLKTLWQSWIDTLADFSSLGAVTGQINLETALRLLRNSANRNSGQLGAPKPGISFLDTIEAASDYNYIWLMGVDNMAWPASPSPNPLLPVGLQSQNAMPRASVDAETAIARSLLERVKHAAEKAVFSYSQLSNDGETSLRPSALLGTLPELCPTDNISSLIKPAWVKPLEQNRFDWIDCTQAPMVSEVQRNVRSGASLLKTMIKSPLNAFLYWRLNAYELPEPQIGLSAADRGNLVHNVLEQVWDDIKDSQRLSQLSQNQVFEQAKKAAADQLRRYQRYRNWLDQSYVELETQRLGKLITDWLEFEKARPAFRKIQSEKKLEAKIGGLSFDMRLDRLDQLENGELLLIDYKTGNALSRKNLCPIDNLTESLANISNQSFENSEYMEQTIEPPSEPQLPLYAINLPQAPDALCFAQVRPEKQQMIGLGREEYIKGIENQENWPELLDYWRQSLEQTAQRYIQGDSRSVETSVGFGQTDPLAPIHRFAEYDHLQTILNQHKNDDLSDEKRKSNGNTPVYESSQIGLDF